MIEFVGNLKSFWDHDLKNHEYVRTVPFVSKNFDHLDKTFYSKDFLLQSFNDELPLDRNLFLISVGSQEGSVSWTCMLPNIILPSHRDTFYMLRKEYDIEIERCFRYLIFLEDWQFGQYVGFNDMHISKWKKGDYWRFDSSEIHFAVNASNTPLHTCQVSTFK